MKRGFVFVLLVSTLLCLLCSCTPYEDAVLDSLGAYKSYEFYTEGVFQDYTDYAKYYFESVDFTDNEYFYEVEPSDLDVLNEHLDNFESWIETFRNSDPTMEIVVNYDFDRSLIDNEDYWHIDSEIYIRDGGDRVHTNYDIYFFDIQTNTLYYFHNNI